jgi:hypothetical protein
MRMLDDPEPVAELPRVRRRKTGHWGLLLTQLPRGVWVRVAEGEPGDPRGKLPRTAMYLRDYYGVEATARAGSLYVRVPDHQDTT